MSVTNEQIGKALARLNRNRILMTKPLPSLYVVVHPEPAVYRYQLCIHGTGEQVGSGVMSASEMYDGLSFAADLAYKDRMREARMN